MWRQGAVIKEPQCSPGARPWLPLKGHTHSIFDKIEAKFDKEFQALEKKYNDIYKPLLAKIQELTGEMEGCAWTLEGDEEEDDDDEYEDEEEGEEEDEEEEEPAAEAAGTAAAKDEGPHSAVPDDAKI